MLLKEAAVPFLLFGASFAVAQNVVHQTVYPDQVIPIQTALNHISIIMLPEKIVRVAAGSEAMQIEWHENDVFIKPLQGGQATRPDGLDGTPVLGLRTRSARGRETNDLRPRRIRIPGSAGQRRECAAGEAICR